MDVMAGTEIRNQTSVQEFIILGFPGTWYFQMSLAGVFSIMYFLTIMGNVSIIAVVRTHRRLFTPMYFFLCNLSFLEIKAIAVMVGTRQPISSSACLLQLFLLLSSGATECFLLAVMAYDRYLAICHPLHYSSLMNGTFFAQLAFLSWLCGFLAIFVLVVLLTRLSFCGPNVINHFICDIDSWIALSCTDKQLVELATFIDSFIVVMISCVITLVSYIYIIATILRLPSAKGWQKAFSTCSPHLTVVTIWYSSTIFLFVKPSAKERLDLNKTINIFNTIVTLLLNPFIYTLRNKEVKEALGKTVRGMLSDFKKAGV
ncbi:olfactory receptor 6F1-like [Emydura macquarii macquarii]|uniref:olfactory receptor 6F1-like n=1 Tax=Emydura macquarii macquarii TaxID=1129001 RepID=UPI00352ADF96